MNSATSQLQYNFARPDFWPHSQLEQLSSVLRPPEGLPLVTLPQAASSLSVSPSFYNGPCTSSSAPSMSIPGGLYQQSVTAASSQLNLPSVVGQSNASVSAHSVSSVPLSPVFPTPTANSLRASHSGTIRFPFPTGGVGPVMSQFERIGTDCQMFQQSIRLNPNLALCSSAPLGGNVIGTNSSPFSNGLSLIHPSGGHHQTNASLPSTGATSAVASVGTSGFHQFASIPRVSQQLQPQIAQGMQFSLGQSATSVGGDASMRDGGQQQPQHLFDLSNSIMSTNCSPMANANAMAAAISKGSFLPQQQQRQQCVSQLKTLAFCDSSASSPLKHSAEATDTVKIPKESATVQLERSCTSPSSADSVSEHRSHQPQMSCQVCYLAASNGLHFGARTCAACAAFFRRSISDQKNYICKRSQRCVIRAMETQGYRKMCRNCRMKRCLEIGMLPENVQNKRNKRDFYFADVLSNAISQQQRQQQQHQLQQMQQQTIKREPSDKSPPRSRTTTERRGDKDGTSPTAAAAARAPTECPRAISAAQIDFHEGDTNSPIFGDTRQQQQNSEYQKQMKTMSITNVRTANEQQQMARGGETIQSDFQTKSNGGILPWGITLREI